MRVIFEAPATGVGYFPGLAKPVVIEADRLAEAEARELAELVAGAGFFDRPAPAGAPPARGAADLRRFVVTVEQGGRCRTLHLGEPIDDPGLRRLVRFLEVKANAVRAAAAARAPKAP
jgi:hypothetical protein